MSDSFLLFDDDTKDKIRENVLPHFDEDILPKAWEKDVLPDFASQSRVYVYVTDINVPLIIETAIKKDWFLAFLPHTESRYALRGFCNASDLKQTIEELAVATPQKVDVLRCNEQLVLSSIVIGNSLNLLPTAKSLSSIERIKLAVNNIKTVRDICPQKMSFTTENETSFSTAAIGLVILKHAQGSSLSSTILSDTHVNDGMCHSLIIAPRSVTEMLRFFIMAPLRRTAYHPDFLGLLKTKSFIVNNDATVNYKIDGNNLQANKVFIRTDFRVLNLLVSNSFPINETSAADKENHKISHLPAGEAIPAMTTKKLPFIARAAKEEFKDLYQLLRENATTSTTFLTLMVLSTLLSSIGLFANSAPVIIGAMILAPLMAPIISLSMALVRQDTKLLSTSVNTLLIGLILSLTFAAFASFILPMEIVTTEIASRSTPTLLDLGVAVISGIAGAYAHARIEAAKSMAGVAIAVALVPPLSVTGIGIGWLDFQLAGGALLLFTTNLVGIILAAAITFLLLGYAPFTRAKKGLSIALVSVFIVSIPLVYSFLRLSDESSIIQQLEGTKIGDVTIRNVQARTNTPLEIEVKLVTPSALTNNNLDNIKATIEFQLQREVMMEAQVIIRR